MSRLDDIEARLKAASPGAITITPSDIHYLLTIARKQADALDSVPPIQHGIDADARFANGYNEALRRVRAALEPTP